MVEATRREDLMAKEPRTTSWPELCLYIALGTACVALVIQIVRLFIATLLGEPNIFLLEGI
jgi:hypothetical protein